MIRFNFINDFKELAKNYSKAHNKTIDSFTNDDYSFLNKQLFNIIQKDYKKEIPYAHLVHSKEHERDIIVYIHNKNLHENTFKKNGISHKFTHDLKRFVTISEIPMDNFRLEIDSGRIENLSSKIVRNKIKEADLSILIENNVLPIEKLTTQDPADGFYKLTDLDDLTYVGVNRKGTYFASQDAKGLSGIIMLTCEDNLYMLNYVNVATRNRGEGLTLKLYEKMMDYIVKNNSILIRSEPSELGAAFIEKKITAMLKDKYSNQPVLSDLTKDLHMHLKLCLSTVNSQEEMNAIKRSLSIIIYSRSHLTRQQFGDVNDYEITQEMTAKDKQIITDSLKGHSNDLKKKDKLTNHELLRLKGRSFLGF